MRTTIDLPEQVLRQVKVRAAMDGLNLKDLIARYVEMGLQQDESGTHTTARRRSPLPVVPKAASAGTIPALSNAEIQGILDEEDADRARGPAGR